MKISYDELRRQELPGGRAAEVLQDLEREAPREDGLPDDDDGEDS